MMDCDFFWNRHDFFFTFDDFFFPFKKIFETFAVFSFRLTILFEFFTLLSCLFLRKTKILVLKTTTLVRFPPVLTNLRPDFNAQTGYSGTKKTSFSPHLPVFSGVFAWIPPNKTTSVAMRVKKK